MKNLEKTEITKCLKNITKELQGIRSTLESNEQKNMSELKIDKVIDSFRQSLSKALEESTLEFHD